MNKDKLITVFGSIICILLTAVVSVVGWIAVQVWDMHPKLTETARRVDRIVDVLPDMKIRIAEEDMQKAVRLALLTAEPTQSRSGDWSATVTVVDFATGEGVMFKAPVKGPDDAYVSYLVSGLANATARDKLSFADYSRAATEVGKPAVLPSYLDVAASYAMIKVSPHYETEFRRVLGEPVKKLDVGKKKVKLEQLLEEVVRNESLYRPPP